MERVVIGDCELFLGDCLDLLKGMEQGSVDAVVTDPPAGIAFMEVSWDSFGIGSDRISDSTVRRSKRKTGSGNSTAAAGFGSGVGFGGTIATSQVNREPFIAFLSSVMSETLRVLKPCHYGLVWALPRTSHWTGTALEEAGFEIRDRVAHIFGQGFPKGKGCLKPCVEDWWLVRKPGKGVLPLSVDECRVPTNGESLARPACYYRNGNVKAHMEERSWMRRRKEAGEPVRPETPDNPLGRWPGNLTHDGSEEVLVEFAMYGESTRIDRRRVILHPRPRSATSLVYGVDQSTKPTPCYSDTGSAARFFYCAKSSPSDRGEGNDHPTVKNSALMEWMVKLITRPGETVLDCFMGSGTTGVACVRTGRKFVGCEIDPKYFETACKRIRAEHERYPLYCAEGGS